MFFLERPRLGSPLPMAEGTVPASAGAAVSRPPCAPRPGSGSSTRAIDRGAARRSHIDPGCRAHRPTPTRPTPAAGPAPPAAGGRVTALDRIKRPRVEALPLASRGLGPTPTSRRGSGGLSPATRKRARPTREGWQHPLPPGPTQSTRPSPGTAPKRTKLASPTARYSRPYDYG